MGWGVTQSNVPYWIVANSWSDEWGMNVSSRLVIDKGGLLYYFLINYHT